MSTLFIIGNGFDLSCGAKTSYSDVYYEYIKEESKSGLISNLKENIKIDSDKWSDFEIAMGQYASKLDNESEFVECVTDFWSFLNNYLKITNDDFIQKLRTPGLLGELDKEIRKLFNGFYTGITNNITYEMKDRQVSDPKKISIISFNYTSIFDTIANRVLFSEGNGNPIIHIHGTLEDNIIMGVDSSDYIESDFPISKNGERCFVKPVLNDAFDRRRIEEAESRIIESDVICVYGAELGDSDLYWRNRIIDWLGYSDSNDLFIFSYESESPKGMPPYKQIENEEKEKRAIMSRWGIPDEYFDQIHIQCRKDIFNPRSIIEDKENG